MTQAFTQTLNLSVTHQFDVTPVPSTGDTTLAVPNTGYLTIGDITVDQASFISGIIFAGIVIALIITALVFFCISRRTRKINACRIASTACIAIALGLAIPSITNFSNAFSNDTITTDFKAIATTDGNVSTALIDLPLDTDYPNGYTIKAYVDGTTNTLYGTNHPESQITATSPASTTAEMTMNSYGAKAQSTTDPTTYTYAPISADSTNPTIIYTTDQAAASGTTTQITYATKLDKATAEDTYTGKIIITIEANAKPTPPAGSMTFDEAFGYYEKTKIGGYYAMQDMITDICTAIKAPTSATAGDEQVITLVDTRNSKVYTVSKLMDGNCWMTQNLTLGSATSTTTLTSSDTDLASGTTSYELPASSSSWPTSDYSTPRIYYDANNTGTSKDEVFYNFNAATAGSADSTVTSGEATGSICPKGWKLPTGNTSGQFNALYTAYGEDYDNMKAAFKFAFAGYFTPYGSQVYSQGYYGNWWSSTIESGTDSYYLGADSNSYVGPDYYHDRVLGNLVRCVSR